MTIQFRSRLQSAIDFKDELKSMGVCCQYNSDTQEYTKYETTANECYSNQGILSIVTRTFYPGADVDNFTCEQATERGCCCACKYAQESENYQDFINDENLTPIDSGDRCEKTSSDITIPLYFNVGLKDNVEQCECSRIGGIWTLGSCPTSGDSQTIRNYCYGLDTTNITEEPDPCKDNPTLPQCNEPEDPIGRCCYNCNESGDCTCCRIDLTQSDCTQLDPDSTWVEGGNCTTCVNSDVYGTCTDSTGACYSVYTDGLNPNDTEQTIGTQLCRTGETFKLYGNCSTAAIGGFPVICNNGGSFSVTTNIDCSGTKYGISQYQANYDGDVTQAGPVFANKTCTSDFSLCLGDGCIFEIQQNSTTINLSITSYIDGSSIFTCTDDTSGSINCTTTQNTAFKKYVIKPSDSTGTSCPYTEVPFGVCCSSSLKNCRFVVDESYCCPDCTFRRWDEVVEKLSRTAIPSLENLSLQDQLTQVSTYFNSKYCGNSNVNTTCEACDNVCNFIGNACISPCGTESEINDAGTCQCLQMTYAVYEQQECPSGCTNCAIQNEVGDRCCKRWYGPFDTTCEGSAQTNPIYSGIGCAGSEPELLGLCCDTILGECYGDNGAQVNQAFCVNDTFLPNATDCNLVNCQPQDPYVLGSCCRNSQCTAVYQKGTGLYDYDLSTDNYTSISDDQYRTCNQTFNTLPCADEGSGTNPNICEPVYACCDHFTNSCANNIPLDECIGPFLQVAKDTSGDYSNNCTDCNFDIIDPDCNTFWQTIDKATTTKLDGTPCSTLSGAAANECICSQAVSCKGDGSGCNLVFLDWNTTDGTYTVNSGSSQYYNPDDGDVLLFFYPEIGCAGAAQNGWSPGNVYYSQASNISEETANYGVCCTFNGLNCLSPDGSQTCNSSCNGSKVTKKYCQNKDGTYTPGNGLYARFIKSNFECKDIIVYTDDTGTSTETIKLPKYDCDICAEIANNSYLYPGIELNTIPGTLPKNTKISYCTGCAVAEPFTASSPTDIRYKDLFTFDVDANLPFNYNLVKNVGSVYVKTPAAGLPSATLNRCCQIPGSIYEDDNISWKTTIQQGWNETRTVGTCSCNGFRNPDCVCTYECALEIYDQYCPDDFPKRLCCNDQSEVCYGILTEYQCSLQLNSKWYQNIGDGQADCQPNQCKKGFCCAALGQCPCTGSGGDCLPGDLKLEQECDAGTWRSYPQNRCSDNPHPCGEEEIGRCCLYNTPNPVNDMRSGISAGPFCLSNITKAQCDGYVATLYSGEIIQSSIWKKDATCQALEFIWNASTNNIYTQSGLKPCVNRLCCALDDTTSSPNDLICRGITSNASCAEISGKRTIPNVSDCSITISGNVYPDRCGIGLCCTNTPYNNPGVGSTIELSECTGNAYLEQYYSPAEASSNCDWGACCKSDGTCERVRRIDCTAGTFFVNQVCGQAGVDSPCDLGAACSSGNCSQKQRGAKLSNEIFHYNTPCTNPDGVPYCKGGYCCCSTPTQCNNGEQIGCGDSFVVQQDLGNTCPQSRFKEGFTTCTSAGCPEPTGSCCVSESSGAGSCTDNITAADCAAISNGVWSVGTCVNNCKGACCSSAGACTEVAYNQTCSGSYRGNLVPCIINGTGVCSGSCCVVGAQDCLQVTNTPEGSAQRSCTVAGGGGGSIYTNNAICTTSSCNGRCCKPTGCAYQTKTQCCANGLCDNGTNFWGGIYSTVAAACPTSEPGAFPCRGACCGTTTCTTVEKNSCASPANFQGYGTTCADVDGDGVADTCEGAAGACCLTTGGCSYVLPGNCAGTFNSGQTCAEVTCDPNVLCCDPTTQSCSTKKKSECTANNGQEVTNCNNCSGSCCQGTATGTCNDNVLASNCTGFGSCGAKVFRYYGNKTSSTSQYNCTNAPCPIAKGACCSISKTTIPQVTTCNSTTQSECVTDSLAWRYWNGCNTLCSGVNCAANFGACCKQDGTCEVITKNICITIPSTTFNPGVGCTPDPCTIPTTYFSCIKYVKEVCPGSSGNPTTTNELLCVDGLSSLTPTLDDLGIPTDAEDIGAGTNFRKQIGTCNGSPIYEYWYIYGSVEGTCNGGYPGAVNPNLGSCVSCAEAFGGAPVVAATTNCGVGACCNGGICQDFYAHDCIIDGGTPYPLQDCSTITCPTGFASELEASCNYCCGCIDGVVRDCCYRTDENGAQVCSSQINDTSYKGVCNANTAYGSYCDTSLEIPQCVWYNDGSPVYSNRSCSNIGDCIHESVANREIVGSSLRILGSSSKECFVDKRIPRACCYMEYDESNIPLGITCTNVCTQRDCELKSPAANQILIAPVSGGGPAFDPSLVKFQSVYTSGALCNKSLLQNSSPHDCGVESAMMLLGGNIGFATRKKRVENVGTCFELIETDSGYDYKCYPTLKGICNQRNGYFVTLHDSDNKMCNSEYAPPDPVLDSNNVLVPQTMSEQTFKSFNLSFGDRFMGGYFIGVYKPNESLVYGSDPIELNSVGFKKSKISTKGSKDFNKGWVLIVSEISNKVRYFDLDTEDDKRLSLNSLHDGFYNTYNIQTDSSLLYQKVKYKNKFGFMDFYIPSVEEMKFFASKIYDDSTNYFTYINKMHRDDIENSVFLTSTAFSNELVNSIYFDTIDGTNFGRIIPVPAYGSKRWNVRFMRRIKLT